MAGGVIGSWRIAVASCRGESHARLARGNEDFARAHVAPPGILVAAVADGAGYAVAGGRGAALAVSEAFRVLLSMRHPDLADCGGWGDRLRESCAAARRHLAAAATVAGLATKAFATTLQLVVASRRSVAHLQIGDGGTVTLLESQLHLLTPRSGTEYANETPFLTDKDYEDHIHVQQVEGAVHGVALFSDGVQPLCLELSAWRPHPGFFLPLFQHVRVAGSDGQAAADIQTLLEGPDVSKRTDDDRTLVVAVP